MLDFEKLLIRHGESWVQDIIERIERNEGTRNKSPVCLEERWNVLMQNVPMQQQLLAA